MNANKNEIQYEPGTVLYLVPIRYWETQEPERCVVIRMAGRFNEGTGESSAYVMHDGYGHEVYIGLDKSYENKDHAKMAAFALWQLYELRLSDGTDTVIRRIKFDKQNNENT